MQEALLETIHPQETEWGLLSRELVLQTAGLGHQGRDICSDGERTLPLLCLGLMRKSIGRAMGSELLGQRAALLQRVQGFGLAPQVPTGPTAGSSRSRFFYLRRWLDKDPTPIPLPQKPKPRLASGNHL